MSYSYINISYADEAVIERANGPFVKWLGKIAKVLIVVAIGVMGIAALPYMANEVMALVGSRELSILSLPVLSKLGKAINSEPVEVYQPRFNSALSIENRLTISAIKINTALREGAYEVREQLLREGVWRIPDYGDPFNRERPTILAAHRFGYIKWSNQFRRENSFYNLPKLKVGDRIEIVWQQRRYIYEIYAQSKGEEITDYAANLILYTCQILDSPIRIFKYARLVEV